METPMTHFSRATMASAFVLLVVTPAPAEETTVEAQDYTLTVQTVVDGLTHPWALAFISDDQFLVTERDTGTLRVGTVDGSLSDPVWEADDLFHYEGETPRSQAGMFDVILHPKFEDNGWAYVSYSRQTDRGAAVTVMRGTVNNGENGVEFAEVEDVFVMNEDDQDSSGLHFGGRMAFDPADASLFL
jgi:aldose sugar dehydrogenase